MPKKSTGQPKKLTDDQEFELLDLIINNAPAGVGFPASYNWNAGIIREYVLREYDVKYSIRGMTMVLHRLGLSFTRPTYTLKKADPEKQEEFRRDFEKIKKLIHGEIAHIIFQDESMLRDYQAIHQTWFLRGKQKLVPTYEKHRGVKFIGALDYESGEVFCIEEEKYDAEVFLKFLGELLVKYPIGKMVLILDNSRIHHAKLIQPFLNENKDRMELVFLPPYSPNLNMIEGFWKWLKERVVYNVFYGTVIEIRKNVRELSNLPTKTRMPGTPPVISACI